MFERFGIPKFLNQEYFLIIDYFYGKQQSIEEKKGREKERKRGIDEEKKKTMKEGIGMKRDKQLKKEGKKVEKEEEKRE